MSATHAVELVLGIVWAAFRIYWLVTALTSKRSRLSNAATHSDDNQVHWCASYPSLTIATAYGITHQPAGDYTPGHRE